MSRVRVGTSGWSYPTGKGTWNGVFYPTASERKRASHANGAGHGAPASERAGGSGGAKPPGLNWTAAAEARLANIPEFVRPMARTGIEQFARERGAVEVDEKILDAARDFFGM